jgi:hypothetical protein
MCHQSDLKFDSKASAARAEVLGIAVIDAVDCDIGCVGKDPTEVLTKKQMNYSHIL